MQNEDLSRLATLYYVDGLTQEDLSQMFSISRATVGRMLRRALQEGIVEIRVRPSNTLSSDLEKALIERFGPSWASNSAARAGVIWIVSKCGTLIGGAAAFKVVMLVSPGGARVLPDARAAVV